MTTALEVGEGLASRPGRSLPPGKTRYPFYGRLGGPQGRSGQVQKISLPPGFYPRTVQPVASRYTGYATRPTLNVGLANIFLQFRCEGDKLRNTGARNVKLGTEANRHALICGFEMLFVIKYLTIWRRYESLMYLTTLTCNRICI